MMKEYPSRRMLELELYRLNQYPRTAMYYTAKVFRTAVHYIPSYLMNDIRLLYALRVHRSLVQQLETSRSRFLLPFER